MAVRGKMSLVVSYPDVHPQPTTASGHETSPSINSSRTGWDIPRDILTRGRSWYETDIRPASSYYTPTLCLEASSLVLSIYSVSDALTQRWLDLGAPCTYLGGLVKGSAGTNMDEHTLSRLYLRCCTTTLRLPSSNLKWK